MLRLFSGRGCVLQASSPEELLKEVLSGYSGEVVVARDLDVY